MGSGLILPRGLPETPFFFDKMRPDPILRPSDPLSLYARPIDAAGFVEPGDSARRAESPSPLKPDSP